MIYGTGRHKAFTDMCKMPEWHQWRIKWVHPKVVCRHGPIHMYQTEWHRIPCRPTYHTWAYIYILTRVIALLLQPLIDCCDLVMISCCEASRRSGGKPDRRQSRTSTQLGLRTLPGKEPPKHLIYPRSCGLRTHQVHHSTRVRRISFLVPTAWPKRHLNRLEPVCSSQLTKVVPVVVPIFFRSEFRILITNRMCVAAYICYAVKSCYGCYL